MAREVTGDSVLGIAGLFVALVILPVVFAFSLIPVVLFALETRGRRACPGRPGRARWCAACRGATSGPRR